MTKICFYTNLLDKFLYACRLVRKARAARCQIAILVNDYEDAKKIDQMLWVFSEYDFLPHVMEGDRLACQTPIIIAENPEGDWDNNRQILVNLSSKVAKNFSLFQKKSFFILSVQAQ